MYTVYLFTLERGGELNRGKVEGQNCSSQSLSKIPTWVTVSPVYKLYQTPVKTAFRVCYLYSYLVHAYVLPSHHYRFMARLFYPITKYLMFYYYGRYVQLREGKWDIRKADATSRRWMCSLEHVRVFEKVDAISKGRWAWLWEEVYRKVCTTSGRYDWDSGYHVLKMDGTLGRWKQLGLSWMEVSVDGWNFRKMGAIFSDGGCNFGKGVSTSERCYIERLLRLPKEGTTWRMMHLWDSGAIWDRCVTLKKVRSCIEGAAVYRLIFFRGGGGGSFTSQDNGWERELMNAVSNKI